MTKRILAVMVALLPLAGMWASAAMVTNTAPRGWDAACAANTTVTARLDVSLAGPTNFVLHSSWRGRLTGSVTGTGNQVVFTPGASLLPGEMIESSLSGLTTNFSWRFSAIPPDGSGTFITNENSMVIDSAGTCYFRNISLADVNGDDSLEIIAPALGTPNAIIASGFPASTNPIALAGAIQDMAIGDFNGDGHADLFLGCAAQVFVVATNNGNGLAFGVASQTVSGVSGPLRQVAVGDLNGDGFPDAVAIAETSGHVIPFINDGSGALIPGTPVACTAPLYGLDVGDLDGNGTLDVVVVGPSGYLATLLNGGGGALQSPSVYTIGSQTLYSCRIADFNRDGRADIVAAGGSGVVVVGFGSSAGFITFSEIYHGYSLPTIYGLGVGDFDASGLPDIAVCGGDSVAVLIGTGTNFSSDLDPVILPDEVLRDLKVGDRNGDGCLDITVAGLYSGIVYTLWNTPPSVPVVHGTNGAVIVNGEAPSASKGTDMGPTLAFQSVTNVFQLINIGEGILKITGASLSNDASSAFQVLNMPTTVAPGATGLFEVVFAPTSSVPCAATLTIRNNSPVLSPTWPYLVLLAGNGTNAYSTADTNNLHYVARAGQTPVWPYVMWETAASNIQDSVDTAEAGETVLVGAGWYGTGGRAATGCSLTNRLVVDKSITVRSADGPAVTFIAGQRGTGSNAPFGPDAVRCVYLTNGAVLVGFTVTNGSTCAASAGLVIDKFGGGVLLSTNCAASNCTVSGNSAIYGGGAYGGAISRSILSGNVAKFEGGGASAGVLNNCLMVSNTAQYGGGAFRCALYSCTLVSNAADLGGAYEGSLCNSIVWYNGGGDVSGCSDARYTSASSGVTHGMQGCVTNEPAFVDRMGGNYRLSAGSPCIDAGANASLLTNGLAGASEDLQSHQRILNTTVDMGAYEYDGAPGVPEIRPATDVSARAFLANWQSPTSGAAFATYRLELTNRAAVAASVFYLLDSTLTNRAVTNLLAGTEYAYRLRTENAFSSSLWSGWASVTTVTNSAVSQTITQFLPASGSYVSTNVLLLNAQGGGSANPVVFTLVSGPGVLLSGNRLRFTELGEVRVMASQSGDVDWQAAPFITNTYTVIPASNLTHYAAQAGQTSLWPYASWADAASNIQDAVDAAWDGDRVLVGNGVYDAGGRVEPGFALTNRVYVARRVSVESVNGPELTSICGKAGTADGGFGPDAVRCVCLTNGAVLSGFKLTGGRTRSDGDLLHEVSGGGALVLNGGILTRCVIVNNSATNYGGGLCLMGSGEAVNSLVVSNGATRGGGACLFLGGVLRNCTVAKNVASSGGGVYLQAGGEVVNSIAWYNVAATSANILTSGAGSVRFTSASDGVTASVDGCITNEPSFKNYLNFLLPDDYRLVSGSRCIDAGNNAAMSAGSGLDGIPRPLDGDINGTAIVDMGCYETLNRNADSSSGGIPDGWALDHGLNPAVNNATNNPDGDAFNNLKEFIADTDPSDPTSYFQVAAVSNVPSFTLCFQASSNRLYTLWGVSELVNGVWTNVPGAGPRMGADGTDTLRDTNVPPKGPFYRLTVELP